MLKLGVIIQQFLVKGSVFIMDMQNMEQSGKSVSRLSAAIDELMKVMQRQKEKFAQEIEMQKTAVADAQEKMSALETQIHNLNDEKEKLKIELIAAQNNTESADKIKELETEAVNRNNKISGLQTEIQNLNTALSNRKTQIEELNTKNDELNNKNNELTQKLSEAENKISEFENSAAADSNAVADLQTRLDEALAKNAELEQKCTASEQKLNDMQQAISHTTENIDVVVARLEKVLEENGASDGNN